jgi:hypothetical protein
MRTALRGSGERSWKWWIVASAFAAACGVRAPATPASSAQPAASAPPPAQAPDALQAEDDLRLELVDPGAEPRAPFRYKFHVGKREKMAMDMKMQLAMEMPNTGKVNVALPTMQCSFSIFRKQVTDDGDLAYEFTTLGMDMLNDAPVKPEIASKLRADLKQLKGLKGHAVVTSRGLTKSADYEVPSGINPQIAQSLENMRQSIRQIATPFPLEPVGQGATWKTTSIIKTKFFSLTQIASYSLVSIKGSRVTIQVQIEQRAPTQVVKLDGAPPDVKTTLDSYQGRGSGQSTVNLERITPVADSQVEAEGSFSAEQGGEKAAFGNQLKMSVRVHPN